MVIRRTMGQVLDQKNEKKEYFNAKYSFGKVTGLEAGMEVYCIPLGVDNGFYEVATHKVKARGYKQGFKGSWFDAYVTCKAINEDGTEGGECLACKLAQAEYDKYPNKEDSSKRMISFKTYKTFLPVLVLGCVDSAKNVKKYPPTKLSLKGYQFAYLEMASSSFQKEILAPFVNKLKDDGVIAYEAEGEELQAQVLEQFKQTIIKVTANESKKGLVYERSYSFVPFSNQNIGAESGHYKQITNYNKIQKVNNDLVDFMTLFDTEVDGICSTFEDADLENYINVDCARTAKVNEAVKEEVPAKSEQVVTAKTQTAPVVEEVPFDEDEIPFGEEDFGSIDDEVTTTVTETFDDIDDDELQMDVDDEFFLDEEAE